MSIEIVVVIALVAVLAVVVAKRKKSKPSDPMPWTPPVLTEPTTIKPVPVKPPADPVLLDRNRKSPGDPGYDPRATRPDPEFSPIEPRGTFYGEGPFDPNGRYIDTQGRLHNP